MGQKKTNESMFSDMARLSSNVVRDVERNRTNVGTSLASRAKAWAGSWKSGRTTKDQLAANKFIDKFTSRGIEALRMAVSSNLVDPNSNQLSAAAAPAPTPAPTPAPATPSGPPPSGPQANATQNYPNMNINVRSPAQTGLNVRMPNVQTQQTPGSTQPQTTTSTTTQTNRPQQNRQANRPQQNRQANRPQQNVPPKRGRKGRRGRFRESVQYQNLNKLFEEYLFLLEQTDTTNNPQPEQPELPSISEYFKEQFLDLYLDGITPQQMRYAQPKINQILNNLPQLVKNENQLQKELRELANIIFTLATSTRVNRNF
jgi:hypothetical protein